MCEAIQGLINDGIAEGIAKGIVKGEAKGIQSEKRETALRLSKMGLSIR